MHSLRRARALFASLTEAVSSPLKNGRVYSTGSELGVTTPVAAETITTSQPLKPAEGEAESSSPSLTETAYQTITSLAAKPSGEAEAVSWPRPSEIPFQARVANSVRLIGYIHVPVQFEDAPDGKSWARTVITKDPSSASPDFWIPISFEGNLAHIAASHLKEKDHVFIEGHLRTLNPAFGENLDGTNVQVMVRSINFVGGFSQMRMASTSHNYDKPVTTTKQDVKGASEDSWRNLLHNPEEWRDYRKAKLDGAVSKGFPDFKRKDRTSVLWLDSAPEWVLSSIRGLTFDGDDSWTDLVENPHNWWDNRTDRMGANYPDFKHKDTRRGLWLDSAPSWVLSKLPPLKPPVEAASSCESSSLDSNQ
ncbi:hypothetical protein SAY86_027623 [Trapa natans]|uniref:Uncharacterized protein n=1 Tax=Trapa natans TaxID=22666 RepID=A0AAN7QKY0_TRANT|nr:hypothetical protein SAY86_027623 [Trapa natans]